MIETPVRYPNALLRARQQLLVATPDTFEHFGLLNGKLGIALYYYETYKATHNGAFLEKFYELLEWIFDYINSGSKLKVLKNYTIEAGMAGLGFLLNHLNEEGIFDEESSASVSETLSFIDQQLFIACDELLQKKHLDFMRGLGGILHYFSFRSYHPAVRSYLEKFLVELNNTVITTSRGGAFINNLGYNQAPGVDLTLAHGAIAIYLVLLSLYEQHILPDTTAKMVKDGLAFIASFKGAKENNSLYPAFMNLDAAGNISEVTYPYRVAWCAGDLIVSYLFYRASVVLKDPYLEQMAKEMKADLLARKTFDETGIEESYFCHGSAGAAFMFYKLYKMTNDDDYYRSACYWSEVAMDMLEKEYERFELEDRYSLQFGRTGVLLATESILHDHTGYWEKAFLLS